MTSRARPHPLAPALILLAIACVAAGPHPAPAQAPDSALEEPYAASDAWPFGRPHDDTPAEFAQYAFMIGVFDCTLLDRAFEDGTWVTSREGVATWRASYVMNGWAILDEYRDEWGSTNVNVRTWDAERGAWNVHWTAVSPTTGRIFEAARIDDRMVMDFEQKTASGFEYIQRFAFGDVTADSYRWTNEILGADGAAVEIGYLECSRR